MERRITTVSERWMTPAVSDIEHIESQTLSGLSVIKVSFHPGTSVDAAVAQLTAISQTAMDDMERSLAAGQARQDAYAVTVRELSRALDEVAGAAASGDTSRVKQALAESTALANKAYGLALYLS